MLSRVPRPPRDLAPGIQHIGINATGGLPYFLDDLDRAIWLRLFADTISKFNWRCIAVCLLTTHWHAIVDIPDGSLARGMHRQVGRYSRRFNERHLRTGYLVRDRYWSRRKADARALLEAYRYVARNPVEAGLVRRPDEWRWSSYGAMVNGTEGFDFVNADLVLSELGSTRADQIRALRRMVDAD